jgi:uncharacterized protein (TIGR02172 family)
MTAARRAKLDSFDMSTSRPQQVLLHQPLDETSIVGKGFTSEVHAWDEGRVIKLFHESRPLASIEREFNAARAVHALGLPAPAVHDLVDVDGRLGIIFERVSGRSLLEQVQARPWTLFSGAAQLAELQVRIHTCEAPASLPSQRERIQMRIEAAADLSAADKRQGTRLLDDLPEGSSICHGDFHPGNVIITACGPVIIDWDTATRGNPLGDVACTSRLLQHANLPAWTPIYMHLLLKVSRRMLHATYLRRYQKVRANTTRREIEQWEQLLALERAGRAAGRLMPGKEG